MKRTLIALCCLLAASTLFSQEGADSGKKRNNLKTDLSVNGEAGLSSAEGTPGWYYAGEVGASAEYLEAWEASFSVKSEGSSVKLSQAKIAYHDKGWEAFAAYRDNEIGLETLVPSLTRILPEKGALNDWYKELGFMDKDFCLGASYHAKGKSLDSKTELCARVVDGSSWMGAQLHQELDFPKKKASLSLDAVYLLPLLVNTESTGWVLNHRGDESRHST
jgi:hypothetical protein